jgi:hypothetical protein
MGVPARCCGCAAGLAVGRGRSERPPPESQFEKVTLNDRPGEPMDLAVLPNGRVLHATRKGQLWLHDPSTGINKLAATFNVYQHDEESSGAPGICHRAGERARAQTPSG